MKRLSFSDDVAKPSYFSATCHIYLFLFQSQDFFFLTAAIFMITGKRKQWYRIPKHSREWYQEKMQIIGFDLYQTLGIIYTECSQ